MQGRVHAAAVQRRLEAGLLSPELLQEYIVGATYMYPVNPSNVTYLTRLKTYSIEYNHVILVSAEGKCPCFASLHGTIFDCLSLVQGKR